MTPRALVRARGGDWCGSYGLVPGPGHSRKDRSLKVWQDDDRVLVHSFAGDDWRECRAHLGLDDDWRPDRHVARRHVRLPATDRKEPDRLAEARTIWEETRPAIHTAAARYLAARGILMRLPACIRYHENTNALVAGLQRPDGTFAGIQRVYLDGERHKGKRSLGPMKGAAVRLTPPAESIQLTESVEDGLALLQMTGKPTWAVPGASFVASFEPPPEVREVILAPDHDQAGLQAIERASGNFAELGRRVRQLLPPEGMDWVDVLQDHEERQAIREEAATAIPRSWVEEFCDV